MKKIETIDDSTATTKVTITINAAFFDTDKSKVFIKTNWLCSGEPINVGDLLGIIEAGKNEMLDYNQKNNPQLKKNGNNRSSKRKSQ